MTETAAIQEHRQFTLTRQTGRVMTADPLSTRRTCLTVAVLVMLSAIVERQGACGESQSVDAPLDVGSRLELAVDPRWIDSIDGARLERLSGFAELTYLNLTGTKMTDAGLAQLSGLAKLGELNLMNTQVTDAGLDALKPLANLASLNLRKTDVSAAGVEALQQALPKCKIDW